MAFLVEDGDGLVDANAYISTAFFDTYHGDRGRTSAVAIATAKKKACIIRASDYIDKRFGKKFRGTRMNQRQGREWPRIDAFDDSNFVLQGVPTNLEAACAEYALRAAIYSELAPDPLLPVPVMDTTGTSLPEIPTTPAPGGIAEVSEKVDVIEETTRYFSPTQRLTALGGKESPSALVSAGNIPEYPAADLLLGQLVRSGQRTVLRG